MAPESTEPHADIATRLAGQLVVIVAVARFCTWMLLPWPSVLSVPLVLAVYLIALWFGVHYLFAALNDLLEVKLEASDRSLGTDE
ncbi:hypothetical protein [Natrinema longum]|uniref:Uncharacterized protein n=1 Tax=Natrinema longum TaxID=370324 RepID=A0A8A2U5T5_9EURY|nr:hypothetical protein [Natrinema longum]MBZ6494660.1 hypothetical protein [Natrinema longum]QSW84026.1 hypothetical protein J0X27_11200 [Natrinema longum]